MLSIFKKKINQEELVAYASGEAISIESVDDAVFSTKSMGDGMAIVILGNKIVAPGNAKVNFISETNHAIGLILDNDMQILIHIGLDSAKNDKNIFRAEVNLNDKVKQGQELVVIDESFLEGEKEIVVPLVILENPKNISYLFNNIDSKVIKGKTSILRYKNYE